MNERPSNVWGAKDSTLRDIQPVDMDDEQLRQVINDIQHFQGQGLNVQKFEFTLFNQKGEAHQVEAEILLVKDEDLARIWGAYSVTANRNN